MPLQLNPWTGFWKHPRRTIRTIVDHDATYYVAPLAGLAGIGSTLDRAVIKNAGNTFEVPQILIFSAIGGFISGIISLYVFAFALRISSKWLGGAASREHLRAAIAWGALPLVAALLIWIPQIALFGKDAFLMDSPQAFSQPLAYWSLTAIEICAAVWALIAMAKTVGEVNQFSAWRALGAIVLAATLLVGALLAIVLPFVLLSG